MTKALTAIELLARRESLGLSQKDLASYLRVPQARISEWENGKRRIPDGIEAELSLLTSRTYLLAERMFEAYEEAYEAGQVPDGFFTYRTDAALAESHGEHDGMPAALHRVAVARAVEMIANEFDVRVAIWCAADIDGTVPPE